MRFILSRTSRWLLRHYPRAWRARYEDEFLALLDESPAGVADVVELARGLLFEHVRALIASVDRASRSLTLLAALRPTFIVVFTTAAVAAGYLLRRWQPGLTSLSGLAYWLYVSLLVVWILKYISLIRRQRGKARFVPALPAWAGLVGLPIVFLTIAFYEGAHVESGIHLEHYWRDRFSQIFMYGLIVTRLSWGIWPGKDLLAAFDALEATEVQLRAARKWVQGCRETIATGVPAPLADAEAEVERWTRERDKALAKAEQLGYRARFRRA
jgi:hypothetical protein